MVSYHGTDKKCAEQIQKNGFRVRKNKNHWLGNGVYFFLDQSLAVWWCKSPTSKFGEKIDIPVIIEVDILSNEDNTIDTRLLEHYNWLGEKFEEFKGRFFNSGRVMSKELKEPQVRCAFFDWLHAEFECADVIIGGFQKKNPAYIQNSVPYEFHIPYVEYQVCVFENELIHVSDVFELERE